MKVILGISLLILTSCKKSSSLDITTYPPPSSPVAIEINSVPPPFDLGGHNPYVVWMNGKRVNLPKKDVLSLVNQVGQDNIPPADVRDIHRGWLFPYFAEVDDGFPITD